MAAALLLLLVAVAPVTAHAAPVTAHAAPIPSGLDRVEGLAEDIYDLALAGKHRVLRRKVRTLAAAWTAYRPRALARAVTVKAVDEAVAALAACDVQKRRSVATARAANAISGRMPSLFAPYRPRIPVAVLNLDYLGRELVLDTLGRDLTEATRHFNALSATWDKLRPMLIARRGGARAASRFDRAITAMKRALKARSIRRLRREANRTLEVVDRLERVFAAGLNHVRTSSLAHGPAFFSFLGARRVQAR